MIDITNLEPACADGLVGVDPSELDPMHYIGVILTSIAISQKRIADSLTTVADHGYSVYEVAQHYMRNV